MLFRSIEIFHILCWLYWQKLCNPYFLSLSDSNTTSVYWKVNTAAEIFFKYLYCFLELNFSWMFESIKFAYFSSSTALYLPSNNRTFFPPDHVTQSFGNILLYLQKSAKNVTSSSGLLYDFTNWVHYGIPRKKILDLPGSFSFWGSFQ